MSKFSKEHNSKIIIIFLLRGFFFIRRIRFTKSYGSAFLTIKINLCSRWMACDRKNSGWRVCVLDCSVKQPCGVSQIDLLIAIFGNTPHRPAAVIYESLTSFGCHVKYSSFYYLAILIHDFVEEFFLHFLLI